MAKIFPVVNSKGGPIIHIDAFMATHEDDLKTFELKDGDVDQPLINCPLACDFGDFKPHSINKMPADTMIAMGVLKDQIEHSLIELSFTEMQGILSSSPAFTHMMGQSDLQSSTLFNDEGKVNPTGTASAVDIERVQKWLGTIIHDKVLFNILKLDSISEHLARFISQSSNLEPKDIIFSTNNRRRIIMDVSVVRFPDLNADYVYLYNLHIVNWSETIFDTQLAAKYSQNKEKVGLSATYKHVKYSPALEVMKVLDAATKQRAKNNGVLFYTVRNHQNPGQV